jgi:hypothetical protein
MSFWSLFCFFINVPMSIMTFKVFGGQWLTSWRRRAFSVVLLLHYQVTVTADERCDLPST